jgi:dihydrofolate reductase
MAAYWPHAETDVNSSEINKRMARKMNSYKKYIYTTSSEPAPNDWTNAELVTVTSDDDIAAHVSKLKGESGRDIHLSGGARLAQTMSRLDLVDEYRFFVHPVISRGAAWFEQIADQRNLVLNHATSFSNGVVGLYYTPTANERSGQGQFSTA